MKKGKKKNSNYIMAALLLLLVGISIGYAALSTTLNINGTSNIGKTTWDVHFENIVVTTGSVTATKPAVIDNAEMTSISYEIDMRFPGDFYEFTVQVKNNGSIPAKVSALPTLGGVSTEQDAYINYTVTYTNGSAINAGDTLPSGSSVDLKVRVEFDPTVSGDQLPDTEQTLSLSFAVNYVQD